MNEADIRFATEKGRRIKLIGHVEKLDDDHITMCVMPQLLSKDKYIYSVEDEFNGVVIKGKYYGKQFMFGRGAGGYPTGSAVLSDIMACSYDYKYEYKKLGSENTPQYSTDVYFRIYLRYTTSADLALFNFKSISESYSSDTTHYVVGDIKLADLVRIKPQLQGRNIFIAAYPKD